MENMTERKGCGDETWRLVLDYFDLKAGPNVSEVVEEGFIPWLLQSPARRR